MKNEKILVLAAVLILGGLAPRGAFADGGAADESRDSGAVAAQPSKSQGDLEGAKQGAGETSQIMDGGDDGRKDSVDAGDSQILKKPSRSPRGRAKSATFEGAWAPEDRSFGEKVTGAVAEKTSGLKKALPFIGVLGAFAGVGIFLAGVLAPGAAGALGLMMGGACLAVGAVLLLGLMQAFS